MGEMILSFWCLEPIFERVTTISLRLTKNELSVRQSKVLGTDAQGLSSSSEESASTMELLEPMMRGSCGPGTSNMSHTYLVGG